MSKRNRMTHLLDKELNGELSALEEDELKCLLRLSPDARRERKSWDKVITEIQRERPDTSRSLNVAALNQRVLRARQPGASDKRQKPAHVSWLVRIFGSTPVLVASSMLIALIVVSVGRLTESPVVEAENTPTRVGEVEAREPTAVFAPVEIDLADDAVVEKSDDTFDDIDEGVELVTIRL